MKSKVLLAPLVLGLLTSTSVNAATVSKAAKPKSVKIVALPTLAEGNFFAGNGGQWFETLLSKGAIYMVGSAEPTTSPTQGEVLAIDPVSGQKIWDLPISGSTDCLATAATLDASGNIWIAGLSAPVTPTPTPVPTPSGLLNPSGIVVPPRTPTRADLTLISLWEVSSRGSLIASYQFSAGKVLEPLAINLVKNSLVISGNNFHITSDFNGAFTKFVEASFLAPPVSSTQIYKDGLYIWKSFLSKSVISGVSGWKPKKAGRVILKVGSRTGTIYSAYTVTDPLLRSGFLSGLGLVVTTQSSTGYKLSLLK